MSIKSTKKQSVSEKSVLSEEIDYSSYNYPGNSMSEEELMARIAWFYYHDGLTQGDIGELLGLSRLKVSRLLEKGRQSGVIRVQINSRYEGCLELENALQKRFNLKQVRVLPTLDGMNLNARLGIGAAHLLMALIEPHQLLAIGFGETPMCTLQYLSGFISSQQIRLVTLSGGVGPYMTGIGQLDAACPVSIIPAPLRASTHQVAATFREERSVRDVILAACAADIAIVGIGAIKQKQHATIMRSGYISDGEQLMFGRKGAIGDILGYFFNMEGELVSNIDIHQELIGISLPEMKTIPNVIGVAGGIEKADAIVAALKGGYINSLVTEEQTAKAMLI
ncbi:MULTISPECIES: transcriptional regulator LsrR [Xenorhabdus]|uniref:DNA-binding transcriptional regulator LsrR (DeoR family) n=2 Tax=Xenorhabdus ehlersii TaxID=290111 RepID=A0ABX9PED0_9GAMM|nr:MULTISPECIES: transcriptional regulator LsrR [Xenorhabdus]RKE87402.1 DNA-binding transcriptional regulator LsrR (DeoR family) [Xenorhabdus ehlersii]